MSNILDYFPWRGDLPFSTVPLNEVDALILSQLSMLNWTNVLKPDQTAALKKLKRLMFQHTVSMGCFTQENDTELWDRVTNCVRFGDLEISDFRHQWDQGAQVQFAAVTLHLPDDTIFVSFRGTDGTIVGWKEDCNMAFSPAVPAQEAARVYLNEIAGKYPVPIRVGGHSKGGNLAVFAAASADDAVRDRILAVYNNDGPGLSDQMDTRSLYGRLAGKLHTFVPHGSIIGMLLNQADHFTVVASNSVSILQHDPYSWQIEGPHFVELPGLSPESASFRKACRNWLSSIPPADRESLIDAVFNVLGTAETTRFGPEFWSSLASNPMAVLSALSNITPSQRKLLGRMVTELGAALLLPEDPGEEEIPDLRR